jgi:two-component system cell cycle sensor histidine kinase/response regulator CckA
MGFNVKDSEQPAAGLERASRLRPSQLIPGLVLGVLGGAITFFAFRQAQTWEINRATHEFERRAGNTAAALQRSIDDHVELLRTLALVWEATAGSSMWKGGRPEPAMSRMLPGYASRYIGLESVSWAVQVAQSQRAAYEQEAQRALGTRFQMVGLGRKGDLVIAGDRAEYFPIHSLEPPELAPAALGFDLASDPVRREAVLASLETRRMAATAPVRLLERPELPLGFQVFQPVYDRPVGGGASERSLLGLVVGSYSFEKLVSAALRDFNLTGINFTVFDGTPRGSLKAVYKYESGVLAAADQADAARPSVVPGRLNFDLTFDLAGRRWWLLFYPSDEYLLQYRTWVPTGVLAGGLLISVLVGAYFWLVAGRAGRVERLVRKRTMELSEINRRLQQEIVQRKFAVDQLRKLSHAVEQSPCAVLVINTDAVVEYANPKYTEMTGYSSAETLGTRFRPFTGEDLPVVEFERLKESLSHGREWRGELQCIRQTGGLIWVSISCSPIHAEDGKLTHFVVVQEDITARKETEERLRQGEERYRLLAEHSTDMISKITAQGQFVYVSPACAALSGYAPAELIGRCLFDLVPAPDQGDVRQTLERVLADQQRATLSFPLHKKDGATVWVEMAVQALPRRGKTEPRELVALTRDISQRRQLQEQFLQAQKMEVVGRLAGGMAHDFNNMLTAIFGFVQIMLRKMTADDPLRSYLHEIQVTGERAAHIIKQLLTFSRKRVYQTQQLKVDETLSHLEKLLRSTLGEDIELVMDLKSGATIEADPNHLSQVVSNLAVNARDAMPRGGRFTIRSRSAKFAREAARRPPQLKPGNYVVISVVDTGCGMNDEICRRAFEPFFTTKGVGKGTGLGLSTVYGIITQCGGEIEIHSKENQGTEFRMYLPEVAAPAEPARKPERSEVPGGQESILVVEDDPVVRRISTGVLRELGYRVIEAQHGLEALEVCQNANGSFDLIFTDVVMPHLGGPELVERLQSQNRSFKVLFTSGFNEHPAVERSRRVGNIFFLEKPFTEEQLGAMVRRVLDSDGYAAR